MSNNESFASRLRELRKNAKLKQTTLAEMSGIDPNLISRYERGESFPTLETAQKIALSLGVSIDTLLNGTPKQEFEVKIIMGVKNLPSLAGVEVLDNTFFYGVQDDKPQIYLTGKVNIATLEDRKAAAAEILKKFWAACWMSDHRDQAEENGLPDLPESK